MNEHPLVSIIISSYNYGRFLRDAIDSALKQTHAHTEVIVVDDGSTDNSVPIIEEYSENVTAILKENGGQASAFNAGFNVSKGEVIVFLDSDDMLLPTAIERAVAGFGSPEVVKVHWPLWKINADGIKTGAMDPSHPLAQGDLLSTVIQYGPNYCGGPPHSPPTSGIAWARQFLERIFPIPEEEYRTCTDQYLLVLAPVYGQLRCLSEPQGFYRIHGSNYSLNPLEEYLDETLIRFEQSCQLLSQHLRNKGIIVDPATWARDSWYHRIKTSIDDIIAVVPFAASFILVDENYWGTSDEIAGRKRIPFLEQDGRYWGQPGDDASAIREIERQRQKGSGFMLFAWPAFWWLDYYAGMHHYLKNNYECIISNDRLIGFSLKDRNGSTN